MQVPGRGDPGGPGPLAINRAEEAHGTPQRHRSSRCFLLARGSETGRQRPYAEPVRLELGCCPVDAPFIQYKFPNARWRLSPRAARSRPGPCQQRTLASRPLSGQSREDQGHAQDRVCWQVRERPGRHCRRRAGPARSHKASRPDTRQAHPLRLAAPQCLRQSARAARSTGLGSARRKTRLKR